MKNSHGFKALLNKENAKTSKGEKLGFKTGVLYLAPSTLSGVKNVCPWASNGCVHACLFSAGRASFDPKIKRARINRTKLLVSDRQQFLRMLREEIQALKRTAARENMVPVVRINGTSDLADLADSMAREFPEIQFYDYTKIPKPWLRIRSNYHLTFSLNERNLAHAQDALAHGVNVAVVFHVKKNQPLPVEFMGRPVIDGDQHDLRFLDGYQGSIIGLRAKGPAKKDASGFVFDTNVVNALAIASS